MKRAITLALTLALVGSLMFMGFAGMASAQDNEIDFDFEDAEIEQETGDAVNYAEVNQQNNNDQVGASSAVAIGVGDTHKKGYSSGSSAAAASSVDQVQIVGQSNYAEVDQEAESGDIENEFDIEQEWELELEELDNFNGE